DPGPPMVADGLPCTGKRWNVVERDGVVRKYTAPVDRCRPPARHLGKEVVQVRQASLMIEDLAPGDSMPPRTVEAGGEGCGRIADRRPRCMLEGEKLAFESNRRMRIQQRDEPRRTASRPGDNRRPRPPFRHAASRTPPPPQRRWLKAGLLDIRGARPAQRDTHHRQPLYCAERHVATQYVSAAHG